MDHILFLDIDGVLIAEEDRPRHRMRDFSPKPAKYLRELLEQQPNTFIVISSSWRTIQSNREDLETLFNKYGIDWTRVIGSTPKHQDRNRGNEIQEYSSNHALAKQDISVIDDETCDMTHVLDLPIIKINRQTGLTQENIQTIKTRAEQSQLKTDNDQKIGMITPLQKQAYHGRFNQSGSFYRAEHIRQELFFQQAKDSVLIQIPRRHTVTRFLTRNQFPKNTITSDLCCELHTGQRGPWQGNWEANPTKTFETQCRNLLHNLPTQWKPEQRQVACKIAQQFSEKAWTLTPTIAIWLANCLTET